MTVARVKELPSIAAGGKRGPLSQRMMRRALEEGQCPWCDDGPFDQVAGHVVRQHGINARQLRDLAGLPYRASLSSPYLSGTLSTARRAYLSTPTGQATLARARAASRGRPRRLSEAAKIQRRRARLDGSRDHDAFLGDVRVVRVSALLTARALATRILGRRWGANLLVSEALGITDTMVESAVARSHFAKPIADIGLSDIDDVHEQLRRAASLAARSAALGLKRSEEMKQKVLRTALAQLHLSVLRADWDIPLIGTARPAPITHDSLLLVAPSGMIHRDHPVFSEQTYCGVRFPADRPNSGWKRFTAGELDAGAESKMCRTCFSNRNDPKHAGLSEVFTEEGVAE